MKIAICVCDNGLGHLRRSIFVAFFLSRRSHSIDLYGSKKGFESLKKVYPNLIKSLNFYPHIFDANSSYYLSPEANEFKIVHRFPDLNSYDIVISDNIIEVLYLRQDAILIAQFFWHEIIVGINENYVYSIRELISKFKPLIVGDKYFSMEYISSNNCFKSTGLFHYNQLINTNIDAGIQKENCLLITGGTTLNAQKEFINIIKLLIQKPFKNYDIVYLDSLLLPENPPDWIRVATYDNKMFSRIKACICRPGLGILTDCLANGVKIFPLYEANNKEMFFNSSILEEYNLSENYHSNNDLLKDVDDYANNINRNESYKNKCLALDFDGARQASDLILNR